MSAWLDWATSGADPGSVLSVCGCVALLFPLVLVKTPTRPAHYVSHANAAQEYLRRFRGHPTSVLAALSRDNLQAASHVGKELSLSKLTYDGLMYASTVAFKEAITGKDGKGSQNGKTRGEGQEDVPQAFLGMERSQALNAALIERMRQTNDMSVLERMQQQDRLRRQTRWGLVCSFLAYSFTRGLPPAHAAAVATSGAANAAATEAIQQPLLWGVAAHSTPALLAGLGLPATAIAPMGLGLPVAATATALFAARMCMMHALHVPSPLWDRITHQAVVRRDHATKRVRPAEHYLVTAAAADLHAMWAIAALTAATDGAAVTTAVFGFLILHTLGCVLVNKPDASADLAACSSPLDLSSIPPETLRERLNLRLAQAMQLSVMLAPDEQHLAGAARRVSGSGEITGRALVASEKEPWAADDAECLAALADGAWRTAPRVATGVEDEDSVVAFVWPARGRGRCVLGAAHARLHAERALAAISVTLAATADAGCVSTAPLAPGDGDAVHFRLNRDALRSAGLPDTTRHDMLRDGGDEALPPTHDQIRWLRLAVRAAERLLDFLGESTADVGALEFHRGAVNMHAAVSIRALRQDGSAEGLPDAHEPAEHEFAESAERECLEAALAACARALEWTPFAAVAQRGRIHQMFADVAELQGDRPAALRHAVRATKCLPGDLKACGRAAQLWRHPAVRANWRRAAPDSPAAADAATGSESAAVTAEREQQPTPWAEKEALEPDAARAMLYIEEAQRLAKLKKAG